jgi:hypothetical protein
LLAGSWASLLVTWAIFVVAAILLQRLVPLEWIAAESYLSNAGVTSANPMPWITFYAAILKPNIILLWIVAIARKLLVAVWHVLNKQVVDRFAEPQNVARSFIAHAYKVGVRNLPQGQSALAFTRTQLDRLGIGKDLQEISWGSKLRKLPPSKLLIEKK